MSHIFQQYFILYCWCLIGGENWDIWWKHWLEKLVFALVPVSHLWTCD